MSLSQFLIAAPSSNAGKTTLTLGLLRAITLQGFSVQPFKCGPDFIDPMHHGKACGRQSVNLDLYMSSSSHVTAMYERYARLAQVSVTEGVMGLFDGSVKMEGSSAHIANLLNLPVILVVDARAMAYSAAALLYGFKNFYSGIKVSGVIFNFVNTESHYRFLQDACLDVGLEALGYLPKTDAFSIPSRHLGLEMPDELVFNDHLDALALQLLKTVKVERLLSLTQISMEDPLKDLQPIDVISQLKSPEKKQDIPLIPALRITVARDAAFCFYYQQNIDVLERFGTIQYISPLGDCAFPETDFLYLPGGYPELFAQELEDNRYMRHAIRDYCLRGGVAYAECGGLMYLGKSIETVGKGGKEKSVFTMAGVFDFSTQMQSTKVSLGYRQLSVDGLVVRGHEFHYSSILLEVGQPAHQNCLEGIKVTNARGADLPVPMYRVKATYASYLHLYWGEDDAIINFLLKRKAIPFVSAVTNQP